MCWEPNMLGQLSCDGPEGRVWVLFLAPCSYTSILGPSLGVVYLEFMMPPALPMCPILTPPPTSWSL